MKLRLWWGMCKHLGYPRWTIPYANHSMKPRLGVLITYFNEGVFFGSARSLRGYLNRWVG